MAAKAKKQAGYAAVAIPLPEGTFSGHSYVYTKEHRESSGGGAGRTLFVVNVDDEGGTLPDHLLEYRLKQQWGVFGDIDSVELGDSAAADDKLARSNSNEDDDHNLVTKPAANRRFGDSTAVGRRARFARIRFATSSAFKKALAARQLKPLAASASSSGDSAIDDSNTTATLKGFAAALQRHRDMRPPQAELQAKVDDYIEQFDAATAEEKQQRQLQKGQPDDDGFVTVTYKKRRRQNDDDTDDVPNKTPTSIPRKKKKKKPTELTNFYRFQMREAKREQLVQLREKFEEDKAKIAKMKAARVFKPF